MWCLRALIAAALLLLTAQACTSGVAAAPNPPSPTLVLTAPTPAPSPSEKPPLPAMRNPSLVPTSLEVFFSGLRSGTYPVHVHSRCNGSRSFHIVVVQSLRIGSNESGAIPVASSYFGRGLCLIVYSSSSLSAVLTTRPI
jgi:hypothetical protein